MTKNKNSMPRLSLILIIFILPSCGDQQKQLSDKSETIEVTYVNWACDCADFIETKFYKENLNYEAKEEDCIFIEPAQLNNKVPDSFFSNNHFEKMLRLTGHFYTDKGVPENYDLKTPEKPREAKIFRYDRLEIVNKEK